MANGGKKYLWLVGLGLLAVLAAGCAGNTVPLSYVASGPVLQSTGKTVIVQELVDQRSLPDLGKRDNGEYFVADRRITDWVSRALADEIARHGTNVSYAGEGYMALDAPVLSGALETLWLEETGTASFAADIKVTLLLHDSQGKLIHKESFWAKQSARFLPSEGNLSGLLSDTLRDLAVPAAVVINRHL